MPDIPVMTLSPLPKHLQLKEILRKRLVALDAGQPVPSEAALCAEYSVSRTTVRHALGEFVREGWIYTVPGKGAFVAARPSRRSPDDLWPTPGTALGEVAAESQIEVLEQRLVSAGPDLAALLHAPAGAQVIRIVRLRRLSGTPFDLWIDRLPWQRFAGLEHARLLEGRLYELLERDYGVQLGRSQRVITAEACGEQDAAWLGLAEGAPLLVLSATLYDLSGVPINYATDRQRGDRAQLCEG
jgi:GntR family transcriptional regulator